MNKRKKICHHNKFEILSEEIDNEELSIECCVIEKFISTTNSIAKDLSITSSTEIRKAMFRMSRKIYMVFKRLKHIKYKQIKHYVSANDSNEFAKNS